MQLYYKNFYQNSLRLAAPPTPEQTDFAVSKPWILCPGGKQNPTVLLPPEMVCSVRQHPLSGTSGRKRYNTLDFALQNRVPTWRFRPYWKPRIQGICYPFEIPAVLESVPTSCKSKLADSDPKTKNPQRVPQTRRGILWGFVVDTRKKDSVKIQLSFSYFSSPQGASADLLPML